MIHTPKFPLELDDRTTWANAEEVKEVVIFHLKNLLLTSPGERISDPGYGVGIKQYLFELPTTGLLNNIAKTIDIAIQKYLGYIDVEDIKVSAPDDSHTLQIRISFGIPNLDIVEDLLLNVSGEPNI